MLLQKEAVSLLFENNHPAGVVLDDGQTLKADNIIYSGTVWNLYGKLIGSEYTSEKRRNWAKSQLPTYPSSVLYAVVDRSVIPRIHARSKCLSAIPTGLMKTK
jgi:prolycopene isomerase